MSTNSPKQQGGKPARYVSDSSAEDSFWSINSVENDIHAIKVAEGAFKPFKSCFVSRLFERLI